jgi:hypothetical protein
MPNRFWMATADGLRRTVQSVKKAGRGVGMALVAVSGVVAGVVYAARKRIASAAIAVYDAGRSLISKTGTALARLLSVFAFGGT